MENEKEFMMTNLISTLIKDEWDAIEGYNGSIATLSDEAGMEDIISILEDIRDEEYVHVGQLESCLSILSGDPTEHIEDGSEEGFEQLELPEEDDEEFEDEEIEEELTEDWLTRAVIRVFLDPKSNEFNSDVKKLDNLCKSYRIKGYFVPSDMYVIKPVADTRSGLKQVGKDIMWYIDRNIDSFVRYSNDSVFREAFTKDIDTETESLHESEKPTKVSEQEMKKIICSMIKQYDASEEEVFDEIQSADPEISKDTVHRLYQMCAGKKQTNESLETSFDEFWEELDDLED